MWIRKGNLRWDTVAVFCDLSCDASYLPSSQSHFKKEKISPFFAVPVASFSVVSF